MKTLGILGGGQLARMLALKAQNLNLKVFILSLSKTDPAAQLKFVNWVKGDPYKTNSLSKFIRSVDVLTFENEFIPAKQIQKVLNKKNPRVSPPLKSLELLQDRYTQKQLLKKYKLKTSPFLKISFSKKTTSKSQTVSKPQTEKDLLATLKKLGAFVLKTRTGGYDGYGTFILKNKKDIKKIRLNSAHFIAEQFINFKRELALLAVRNKKGTLVFSPLVESKQENSRCLWVKGPTTHKKLNALKRKIKTFLKALNYEGVLAFELFDTGSDLLINELAPRVHNSGHYSLDGLTEDQFTLHLKAIFNLPLKTPKPLKKGFAMLNLLGEGTQTLAHFKLKKKIIKLTRGMEYENKNFFLWWYGKTKNTKGRKMGHLNSMDSSPTKALSHLLKARKLFKL